MPHMKLAMLLFLLCVIALPQRDHQLSTFDEECFNSKVIIT